jgi:hypothetical protein
MISVLILQKDEYIPTIGLVSRFMKSDGAEIEVTKLGHFRVKYRGKSLLVPMTSVAIGLEEDEVAQK